MASASTAMDEDVEIISTNLPPLNETQAKTKRDEGNDLYQKKQYKQALEKYTQSINLHPIAPYYGNRSACYIMLGAYKEALQDAKTSVEKDENFIKGYVRIAKCHIANGDLLAARSALQTATEKEPGNVAITLEKNNLLYLENVEEDSRKSCDRKEFRKVVYLMSRAGDVAPNCSRYKVLKAECLALLGRCKEAQDVVLPILQLDERNVEALYVRGLCFYFEDNMEKANKHFTKVLQLFPDHEKAKEVRKKAKQLTEKKEAGTEAYKSGKYQEAYDRYSEALTVDSNNKLMNSKLHFNRATMCYKMNKLKEAIEEFTRAIALDENYIKAYVYRGKCYMEQEEYDKAVQDYEKVFKMDKTKENKRFLDEANLALKRSKRKDYYKVLGVTKAASLDEIKAAYRSRARNHHPDKHAGASEEEKKEQEKKFKEVGEAYQILSDPKKKWQYDSGQDMEEEDDLSRFFFTADSFPRTSGFASFMNSGGSFPSGFGYQFG